MTARHQQVDRQIWVVVGQRFDDAGLTEIEKSGAGRLVEKGRIDTFLMLDGGCDGRDWARPDAVGPAAHVQSRGCCCATPGPLRFPNADSWLHLSANSAINSTFRRRRERRTHLDQVEFGRDEVVGD